ncbi:SNF2-related protein, partial [Chloroflexota bacterium]
MSTRKYLIGVINPLDQLSCFATPVFGKEDDTYLQRIADDGNIQDFIKIQVPSGFITRTAHEVSRNIGDSAIFAFYFSPTNIMVESKDGMRKMLQSQYEEFTKRPFLRLEIADFISDEILKKKALFEASASIRQLNDGLEFHWIDSAGVRVPGVESQVRTMFSKGDKVIIQAFGNRIGIIDGEPRETKGKLFYPVSIDPSQSSSYYPVDTLDEFIPPKRVEQLLKEKVFLDPSNFIQQFIYKKLERPLADNLYTFYASRTEFLVHQFKPVLKFFRSPKQRLLLADEVGLGKTIEVGIIITEISARLGGLSRVLIVCPSMLTQKWETEMQKRFGLNFNILRRGDFAKFLDQYAEYGESVTLKGIISLQALRSSAIIDRLREVQPRLDIVVVDEAHHMRNPDTLSSELGEELSDLSDAMLLLTATPLQLGTPDLFNLLELLVPEEFSDFLLFRNLIEPNEYINNALRRLYDPQNALQQLLRVQDTTQKERFINNSFYREAVQLLSGNNKLTRDQAIRLQKLLVELNCMSYIFTRTKKRDVEVDFPTREARVIRVKFTAAEMNFYNAITDFVSERFTSRYNSSQGISFAVIMPQRQVASCIQVMKGKLDSIIKQRIVDSPSRDNGDIIDTSADIESKWKLENGDILALRKVKDSASRLGEVDTKFDKFLDALRQIEIEDKDSVIIVFAFFKKTLEYLMKRLSKTEFQGRLSLIHGDIHTKDRQRIIKDFREASGLRILLSSEVGGEGLDFEFCSVIFNYDLPWNPMRVEQRIGRLDRYGQSHEKILIYNFSMAGTIDDEILNRLYSRINVFEKYIGDLEAILGEQIVELTKDIFNTKLTREQKVQKIEKVAENIVRKQKELEEFETECQKFIGQDEYFNKEVSRILETKRFITSSEVLFFLNTFLRTHYPKTTLIPPKSGRGNMFV